MKTDLPARKLLADFVLAEVSDILFPSAVLDIGPAFTRIGMIAKV